jgi:hypothetical protein
MEILVNMMEQEKLILRQVCGSIEQAIGAPVTRVHFPDGAPDAIFELSSENGEPIRILLEVKAHGFPRDIKSAIELLRSANTRFGDVLMVAAPSITEHGRRLLKDANVGYWDQSGSMFLRLPGHTIFVDRPILQQSTPLLKNPFSGKSTNVIHALLMFPDRSWHIKDLATLAEVSQAMAHRVCETLENELLLERRGTGPSTTRILTSPAALLERWSSVHSMNNYKFLRFYEWTARIDQEFIWRVTKPLERAGISYALTLASGAQFVAPFASSVNQVAVLVPESIDIQLIYPASRMKDVDEGENILFLSTSAKAPFIFRRAIEEVWVASDVQLYIDLVNWPQRGKEQAEHLREERMGF